MLRHFREKSEIRAKSADRKSVGDLCGRETRSTSMKALLYVLTCSISIQSSWFYLPATYVRILELPIVPRHLRGVRGNMDPYN